MPLVLLLVIGLTIFYFLKKRVLPPGPRRYPLIGNLYAFPRRLDSTLFSEMGERYASNLLYFNGLGTSLLVLNSYEDAQELLEKRSGIYSGRPYSTIFNELSGWAFQFVLWTYSERWRTARKIFTRFFNAQAVHRSREVIYVRRLLLQLLDQPHEFFRHIKLLNSSMALSMGYGFHVDTFDDPFVSAIEEGLFRIGEVVVSGPWLVDLLPPLKYLPEWFPGATNFQRRARVCRELAARVLEDPFEATKENMRKGEYESSFLSKSLEELEATGESQDEDRVHMLKQIAGQVYVAASDSTRSAMTTFFLAMVTHPEIQAKAQQELDSALDGRLPEHEDLPSLPYLNALVLEVLRWKPVTPIGIPHLNIVEDLYRGYSIPVGTTVFANQRAMLHDPKYFPDPLSFKPERFLTRDGKLDPGAPSPLDIAFGFGRRTCPGRHIALSLISYMAACVLSTFTLSKKIDEGEGIVEPDCGCVEHTMFQLDEFPCDIRPRSGKVRELIRSLEEKQE